MHAQMTGAATYYSAKGAVSFVFLNYGFEVTVTTKLSYILRYTQWKSGHMKHLYTK